MERWFFNLTTDARGQLRLNMILGVFLLVGGVIALLAGGTFGWWAIFAGMLNILAGLLIQSRERKGPDA